MLKDYFILIIITSVVYTSTAVIPPAGKCKDIKSVPINFNGLMKIRKQQLAYVPDDDSFHNLDSVRRHVVSARANVYQLVDNRKTHNNSLYPYEFTFRYGIDQVIFEETVDEYDEKERFRVYTIDIVPGEKATLIYRCSDTGILDIDTRYIVVLGSTRLSEEGERRLLLADRKCQFSGGIRKLANAIDW